MASDKLSKLDGFHSKVAASQLKTLHKSFNIPESYKLMALAKSASIYHHGEDKSPLYVKHLEYGLRLPMHPFICKVSDALGISPMQMKPNSIAMLVGFVVMCYWLGIQPSMNILNHLVIVKVLKVPHYHLQVAEKFKIVTDPPESNKDWKERFVWVEGEDLELGCSNCPVIKREALEQKPLSEGEKRDMEQILANSGSRKMESFLDNLVLRVSGILAIVPTDGDRLKAHNLTFRGKYYLSRAQRGLLMPPVKRHREDVVPAEGEAAVEPEKLPQDVPPTPRRRRPRKIGEGSKKISPEEGAEIVNLEEGSPKSRERRSSSRPRLKLNFLLRRPPLKLRPKREATGLKGTDSSAW